MLVTAQIISILGMLANVLAFQCKKNRNLFIVHGLGSVLFAISFFMLGSPVSALVNLINITKCAFAYSEKTRTLKNFLLICILFLVTLVLAFENLWSVVIVLVQMLETYSAMFLDGSSIRKVQLFAVSPAWFINNTVVVFSLGGIIGEMITVASVLVSFIRYKKTGFEK